MPKINTDDIENFVSALFVYAEGYVSLRVFDQLDNNAFPIEMMPVCFDSRGTIMRRAVEVAERAARYPRPTVFCPPVATFKTHWGAGFDNLMNGVAISVEVDNADPRLALKTLSSLRELGAPTIVVDTGSTWLDASTGQTVPKQHFHWRLSEPTSTPEEHNALREACRLAAILVSGDKTLASPVRPLRWPGSLNRKATPTLARIAALNWERQVHLDDALTALREKVAYVKAPLSQTALPRELTTGDANARRAARAASTV
jgi:hypothetical protein